MRVENLAMWAFLLLFPFTLSAGQQDVSSLNSDYEIGRQQLKTLKDVNIYNNIHDNYHTGGTPPFDQ